MHHHLPQQPKRIRRTVIACVAAAGLFSPLTPVAPVHAQSAAGFTFISDGDSVTVTGCRDSCRTIMDIPSELGGLPVTAIGADAFKSGTFARITIPDSVSTIGDYAFAQSSSAADVVLPPGLAHIGSRAFLKFSAPHLTLGKNLSWIGDEGLSQVASEPMSLVMRSGYIGYQGVAGTSLSVLNLASAVYISENSFSAPFGGTAGTLGTVTLAVKTIPAYAFSSTNIDTLHLLKSVRSIGYQAFGGDFVEDRYIHHLDVDAVDIGQEAFYRRDFGDIVLGPHVASVGFNAFQAKFATEHVNGALTVQAGSLGMYSFAGQSFTSVTIGPKVTHIALYAFGSSFLPTSLGRLRVEGGDIDRSAFSQIKTTSVYIGPGVNSLGLQALSAWGDDNPGLGAVTIEAPVISPMALQRAKLTSLVLSKKVRVIGALSFAGLQCGCQVAIPSGVIDDQAFTGADITAVTIGAGVSRVGRLAFQNLPSLTSATVDARVIDEQAFESSGLTSVRIGPSVRTIGPRAFGNNYALASISLAPGVRAIGEGAFAYSVAHDFTVPNSVVELGDQAFTSTEPATVTVGRAVTALGKYAVMSDASPMVVSFFGPPPTGIGEETFVNTPNLHLRVLPSQEAAWRKALSSPVSFDQVVLDATLVSASATMSSAKVTKTPTATKVTVPVVSTAPGQVSLRVGAVTVGRKTVKTPALVKACTVRADVAAGAGAVTCSIPARVRATLGKGVALVGLTVTYEPLAGLATVKKLTARLG